MDFPHDLQAMKEYYVGWGTLALINTGLAQSKNRGSGTWFLASLFLGPIATLILVLLDKVPSDANFT
jgi:hypothetical protein